MRLGPHSLTQYWSYSTPHARVLRMVAVRRFKAKKGAEIILCIRGNLRYSLVIQNYAKQSLWL